MLEAGTVLDGRYRVEAKVGEGGMGVVCRAYDEVLEKVVALKTLHAQMMSDPKAQRDLRQEVALCQDLTHPNIVRVYDLQVGSEVPYMTMEYVDGTTLALLLARRGKIPLEEFLAYAEQILSAIAFAHSLNVVHRDIKPQNVMLTKDGTIKVMDFGIAQVLKDAFTRVTGQMISGTLNYMAPEHIRGKPADKRSDIYSLGCMFYELLNGRAPFWTGDVVHQHLHEKPQSIEGLPYDVNQVVLRCLEKEPDDRFQEATLLADALLGEGVVRAAPTTARTAPASSARTVVVGEEDLVAQPPADPSARSREFVRPAPKTRAWIPLILVAALVAVIVVALVLLWPSAGGPPRPRPDRGEEGNTSFDTALELELGRGERDNLDGGDQRYFRFEVEESDWYEVLCEGSADTKGELFDDDEDLLAEDGGSGEGGNFRIARQLGAGTYFVVVEGEDDGETGRFEVIARRLDCASAGAVTVGGEAYGSVQGLAPAYFRLNLSARGAYSIYSVGRTDTVGELLGGDCNPITTDDDGGQGTNFMIAEDLVPGTYFVRVRGYNDQASGQFALRVARDRFDPEGGDCAGARPIDLSSDITLRAIGDALLYYRFSVPSSGFYRVSTLSSLDTVGAILDGECNQLAFDDDNGQGRNFMIERGLQAGEYFLAVRGYNAEATGTFRVRLEVGRGQYANPGGGSCPDALEVPVDGAVDSSVSGTAFSFYRFRVNSRAWYAIYSSGTTDTVGELLDNRCTPIAFDDDGGRSTNFVVFRQLLPGTYYVRVRGYNEGTSGPFRLHVETPPEVRAGAGYSRTMVKGERLYFRFDVQIYSSYSFYTTGSLDTRGFLLDSDMQEVATHDDISDQDFNFRIGVNLNPGTYFIVVEGFGINQNGQYRLEIGR